MTLSGPVTPEYLVAWGRHTHRSPLYAHLVEVTASTPGLLEIIQRIHHRPPPNVFLAAIQLLLFEDPAQPLASFYASIVDDPRPVADVDGTFESFVVANQERIVEIANTRYTQTNETRRCVALLPGAMASPFESFHVVEIGASAGLNLALDRFRYDFDGLGWGPDSPVRLTATTPGQEPRLRDIEIRSRIGIDVNPLDPHDAGDRLWLDALIWPEHRERRERLRAAFDVVDDVDTTLVAGSAVDELAPVLASLPVGEPVVVLNSFVLIQLDEDDRNRIATVINEASADRPVFRVSLEFIDKDDDWARLLVGDGPALTQIATAHPHGEWVDFTYPD